MKIVFNATDAGIVLKKLKKATADFRVKNSSLFAKGGKGHQMVGETTAMQEVELNQVS